MTDAEAERMVEELRESVETTLRALLVRAPRTTPACVGIVARDGVAAQVKATSAAGYAAVPMPAAEDPGRPLYDAVGAALRRPRTADQEWIVLVHHDTAGVRVAVLTFAFATKVRRSLAEVLPEPRAEDERRAEELGSALFMPDQQLGSVGECVEQVDGAMRAFADMVAEGRALGVALTTYGRGMINWRLCT